MEKENSNFTGKRFRVFFDDGQVTDDGKIKPQMKIGYIIGSNSWSIIFKNEEGKVEYLPKERIIRMEEVK